jgi:putative Ca2+/H+ antiporter (TMEM165/GDT1 family)
MIFPRGSNSKSIMLGCWLCATLLLSSISSSYAQEGQGQAATISNGNDNGNEDKQQPSAVLLSPTQVFNKLDVNHDSSLTLKDFQKLDSNQDAEISIQEFTSHFGSASGSSYNTNPKANTNKDETGGFVKGFTSSTAMIIATEIGDKTFFIAAVLSMRHPRLMVFAGAILALSCMTVLSTMMGLILPSLLPRQYTHIIGGLLFLYFGVKLIYDSRSMSDKVSDELEEVEEELGCNKKNDKAGADDRDDAEAGISVPMGNDKVDIVKNVFFQAFLLTFIAEWGDRSQIATIALAAAKDPFGVTFGACFGHSLCTGMAVIGGRMLASKISEKTVTFWGGVIFLAFGVHAFIFDV